MRVLVAIGAIAAVAFAVRSLFHQTDGGGVADAGDVVAANDDPKIATKNGLISVRYPSTFTATTLDDATVELDDENVSLTVGALGNRTNEDASSLAERDLKLLREKLGRDGATFSEASQKPFRCLGKYEGVQTEETLTMEGARPTLLRGCFFVHDHVAGFITYLVPQAERAREQPAIARILASIEVTPR
ncbi:hypothetical protein BH09MYX1_BH09MYX1_02560 [soil metagenome]